MTFEECADAIIALINSRPTSPRKEEIVELLMKCANAPVPGVPSTHAYSWVQVAGVPGSFSIWPKLDPNTDVVVTVVGTPKHERDDLAYFISSSLGDGTPQVVAWSADDTIIDWTEDPSAGSMLVTQDQLETAADAICKAEETITDMYGNTVAGVNLMLQPGEEYKSAEMHAQWAKPVITTKVVGADVNPAADYMRLARCNVHSDGIHQWIECTMIRGDVAGYICGCGAQKPK